jgi:hypothetical protein
VGEPPRGAVSDLSAIQRSPAAMPTTTREHWRSIWMYSRGLIGGWKENFSAALEMARGHGRELAARHRRGGHDVILPQLVTVHDHEPEPAFAEVACAAEAAYVEVALVVDDREHLQRVRDKRPANEVEVRIQAALKRSQF